MRILRGVFTVSKNTSWYHIWVCVVVKGVGSRIFDSAMAAGLTYPIRVFAVHHPIPLPLHAQEWLLVSHMASGERTCT